jgi:integrase/recombinase XerD
MATLAPLLQRFFTDRLMTQKHASSHTIASYRDAWRLLLGYAQQKTGTPPWKLQIGQLDTELITAFLRHLEHDRGNSERTRNARLAAIHSLFRYAALHAPEDAHTIQQVLAMDGSRITTGPICWLTSTESKALLAVPDRTTRIGRRDYAMLLILLRTGLRVSELTGLTRADVHLGTGAHIRSLGKGRKARSTPLDPPTAAVLNEWLTETGGTPADPLFPNRHGQPLSRDTVAARISKYRKTAAAACPTLLGKTISPHTLRHSNAMALHQAGVDIAVLALWLGHSSTKSTDIYIHADIESKEQALAHTAPPDVTPGRYKPPDPLLAFLESL